MLASGVAAGIFAGIAFGGDWRRLSTFTLKPWPVLVTPVAPIRSVFSLGDFLVGLGGFLIPFMWLQPAAAAMRGGDLRSPNFAFFWMGQAISRFGDPITLIALTYVTYRATQSALLTALAVLTATIPNALFGFFGGAVADAIGHRRVMLWCDILRAIVLAVVPLLIAIDAPLAVVFAAVLASGLCAAIFTPARIALVQPRLDAMLLRRGHAPVYGPDLAGGIAGGLAVGRLV